MARKPKGAEKPPNEKKICAPPASIDIRSPYLNETPMGPRPAQDSNSLEAPPPILSSSEAHKSPRTISRVAQVLGSLVVGTMGVTPTAAASSHASPHQSSEVLPAAGELAKKNTPAGYQVSTGPGCQLVVVFAEPPVQQDILQLLAELQQAARNQQSTAEFSGWGTSTLTITVKLTAATALIKALEHFIVEILKIRVTREITLKVGDKEIKIKGTNDVNLACQTLEQLQEPRITLK